MRSHYEFLADNGTFRARPGGHDRDCVCGICDPDPEDLKVILRKADPSLDDPNSADWPPF